MELENNNTYSNKFFTLVPWVPVVGGIAAGSIHNLYHGGWVKSRQFSRSGALGTVNTLKQWEIKNLAFLAPAIPLVLLLGQSLVKGEGIQGVKEQIRDIPMDKVVKTALLVAGTVALVAIFAAALPVAFDPSGHVMLRLALAIIQSDVIGHLQDSGSEALSLPTDVWALGDAVQLYNSTAFCHSAAETIAGAAAVSIVALAASLISYAVTAHNDKTEEAPESV